MSNKAALASCLIVSALLFMFLAAGCTSVGNVEAEADYREAKAQIERRLHEVLEAAERKDFDRLESYHLYGPKFSRFSGSSPARLDAVATRKIERDGLASLKGLKMRADSLQIDVFGDVGIATFILDYSFDSGSERIHHKDRSTLVFVSERGAWKIAHEHLSPIEPVDPGSAWSGSRPAKERGIDYSKPTQ